MNKKDQIAVVSFFAIPLVSIIGLVAWMNFLSPLAHGLHQLGL